MSIHFIPNIIDSYCEHFRRKGNPRYIRKVVIDKNKEIHPYTIAQVVDHGWIWKTPLQSRIGSGLIFNRSVTDIEDAKNYFCEHWDNRISPENVRVIDWTPYYDRNQWDKNVVSIGLSAGFLEPLESTGIELIIQG